MAPLPAYIINLDDNTLRLQACLERCERAFGPALVTPQRLSAVDGRRGRLPTDAWTMMSPYTEHLVRHRAWITDSAVLNSAEAAACYLSHRACWHRIANASDPVGRV